MHQKKRSAKASTTVIVIVIVLLLVCGGACGGGYWYWTTKIVPGVQNFATGVQAGLTAAGEVAKDSLALSTAESEFTGDLSTGDTDKAYNLTSKKFKEKYKTPKDFKDYVEKNPDLKKSMLTPNVVVGTEGKPSTVTGAMGAKTVVLTFVKEDTLFKVDAIEIK